MDIKITGVTLEILKDASIRPTTQRQFILGKMAEAIDGPREQALAVRAEDNLDQESTPRRSAP